MVRFLLRNSSLTSNAYNAVEFSLCLVPKELETESSLVR